MSGVSTTNQGIKVSLQKTAQRQTPKTDFGHLVKTGMAKAGGTIASAGNLAAPFVPGGAVLTSAISGLGQVSSNVSAGGGGGAVSSGLAAAGGMTAGGLGGGGLGGSGGVVGGGGGDATFGRLETMAAGGDSQASLALANKRMMELNQGFNMQYLMLQQEMQNENRQFTTLSNVLKTKHDTAKTAINNIK